jgi:hypothetical protein
LAVLRQRRRHRGQHQSDGENFARDHEAILLFRRFNEPGAGGFPAAGTRRPFEPRIAPARLKTAEVT